MSPEDVLIEAIQAAARYGDSVELRVEECDKLRRSIQAALGLYSAVPLVRDDAA